MYVLIINMYIMHMNMPTHMYFCVHMQRLYATLSFVFSSNDIFIVMLMQDN